VSESTVATATTQAQQQGAAGPVPSLSLMIYGPSKAGKSTLAATSPAPRLMLDAEHGHKFLGLKIKYWDPNLDAPPIPDGTWDTCVVVVRDYQTVQRVYAWLNSGSHPFESFIMDSISEIQTQCLEQIAGRQQVQMQQWGELLRHMTGLMRDIRDLTMHPTKPLSAVVLTAMATHKDGKWRPYLQGQSATSAPYYWDITGYINAEEYPDPDPTKPNYTARRLYIGPSNDHVSGERVGGRLGEIVEQDKLNIITMIQTIYGLPADYFARKAAVNLTPLEPVSNGQAEQNGASA
jgi:hypothetical protein